MEKYYITFGQCHAHAINGKTFDKDCVAEIESEDRGSAHSLAMDIFDQKFHNCIDEIDIQYQIEYYPRGIIKV